MENTQIKVGKKNFALISPEDYDLVASYTWWFSTGYAYTKIDDKVISMHRLILGASKPFEVDHINRNRLDNRRENLRLASHQQNMMNANYKKRPTSSIFKGVYMPRNKSKWKAKIQHNGKAIHLGTYIDEKTAAMAYNNKAKELFGEFATLNKI